MPAARSPRTLTVYVGVAVLASATAGAGAALGASRGIVTASSALAFVPILVGAIALGEALRRRDSREPVGPADVVTGIRAALVALIGGWAVLLVMGSAPAASWWLTGIAALALALDGVDGAVARAGDRSTSAGARLDAETDAVLMAVLSVVVSHEVGPWILLAGALRYAFAALWRMRWRGIARAEAGLPPRQRRRFVAASSAAALVAATAPVVPIAGTWALSAVALSLLVVSFGLDAVWLEAGRGCGIVGDVVGRAPLQRGVDAADILAEDAKAQQLHSADCGHDDDG